MNKKSKGKITLLIMILVLMMIGLTSKSIAWDYIPISSNDAGSSGRNFVYGIHGEVVELKTNNKFKAYQGVALRYRSVSGDIWYSTMSQPNIFCVEHGMDLASEYGEEYIIGDEYTINNPKLAYILSKSPDRSDMYTNSDALYYTSWYNYGGPQQALWKFLYDNKNSLIWPDNMLLSSTNIKDPTDATYDRNKDSSGNLYYWQTNANTILNEANDYAANVSISKPTLNLSWNADGKLKITVGGSFTKFKIQINDSDYGEMWSKEKNNNNWTTDVDVSGISASTATVKIIAYTNKLEVKFRVLASTNHPNSQRLIAVTSINNVEETQASEPKTEEISANVSLQKHIGKLNDKDLTKNDVDIDYNKASETQRKEINNDKEAFMLGRWSKIANNTLNNKQVICTNTISPNYQTEAYYKTNNPVMIEVGDTVTYYIKAYNNHPNGIAPNAKDVEIIDYLTDIETKTRLTIGDENADVTIIGGVTVENLTGKTSLSYEVTDNTIHFEKFDIPVETEGNGRYYSYNEVVIAIKIRFNKYNGHKIENYAKLDMTNNQTTYRTEDADYIKMRTVNVSLQKYITNINNNGLEKEDIDLDGGVTETERAALDAKYGWKDGAFMVSRWAKKAKEDTKPKIVPNGNMFETFQKNSAYYKINNPVIIEAGDTVTYRIAVINNENVTAKKVKVQDYLTDTVTNTRLTIEGANADATIQKVGLTINSGTEQTLGYSVKDKTIINFNEFEIPVRDEGKHKDEGWYGIATIKITVKFNKHNLHKIENYAKVNMPNNITEYRKEDADYIRMKEYRVSLYKFVSEVNGTQVTTSRDEKRYNKDAIDKNNINNYNPWKYNNVVTVAKGDKVTYTIRVTNDGETQIRNLIIKDILPSGVNLFNIESAEKYDASNKRIGRVSINNIVESGERTLKANNVRIRPGESIVIQISVRVTEPNISVSVLENTAKITEIQNKNNIVVTDSTPEDNQDADYIQMNDITISGTVWNDIAWNKEQNNYNGLYDNAYDMNGDGLVNQVDVAYLNSHTLLPNRFPIRENCTPDVNGDGVVNSDDAIQLGKIITEGTYPNEIKRDKPLPGVKVYLYRYNNGRPIAEATTDVEGRYTFDLNYIKGPKVSGTNRWRGTYHSYYVVFEYDGITYTSSPVITNGRSTSYADITSNSPLDSNAREKLDNRSFDGKVDKTREEFNNQFSTINNNSGINYTTKNEERYIPQSNHNPYNTQRELLDKYKMQSSTALIRLSKTEALESQLQHVNLGLRGRDIFDLELKNDIYSTKVTVNGKQGVYQYDNNKVTLRKEDISNQYSNTEDMANPYSEGSTYVGDSYDQGVRKTDIDSKKTGANVTPYEATGLEIEVTYKLTVQNVSSTDGRATRITDYYDSKYNFARAYGADNKQLTTTSGPSGTGYKSIVITTPTRVLKENDSMDIYVVYTLNNATQTLKALADGTVTRIPTYNMAEITEYRTQCANGQTEFTRGLLDKDSAPGSANREQVRLTTTVGQNTATTGGNPTTTRYYFNKNNLSNLKYEDDTCAAPILYFAVPSEIPDSSTPDPEVPEDPIPDPENPEDPTPNPSGNNGYARTIIGTVFRDTTITDVQTKIKTGNGKLDRGEVGVYGATVKLIELNPNGTTKAVRYSVTTDKDGKYTISGFLPGDYILQYQYGDTTKTVLLNQSGQDINQYSFNGEDYQSTNNERELTVTDENGNQLTSSVLNNTKGFWYVYNEKDGISTAIDMADRRSRISDNVTKFSDEQMTVLNNMRDGKNAEEAKITYKKDNKTETVTVDDIIDQTNMYAYTPSMEFLVEKTENLGDRLVQRSVFRKYVVRNMNFGIAEVPVTTINLQKHVQSFTITDSTGKNVLASMAKDGNGNWQTKGNVLVETFDVSIEDDKLQGARLEITYEIISEIFTEKNFDNKTLTIPTIKGIVDYIDNNLSYNPSLGENEKYWELTTYNDTLKEYALSRFKGGTEPKGTVDPEGNKHTVVVKAQTKKINGVETPKFLDDKGNGTATITLEKVLSATDATLDQIITSTVETFAYSNTVEITGLDYHNVTPTDPEVDPQRDRIRTPRRYIIIPGVQHDSATSEIIVIHPPTGDSNISVTYYVLAIVSLIILGAGTFCIKKFVLRTRK